MSNMNNLIEKTDNKNDNNFVSENENKTPASSEFVPVKKQSTDILSIFSLLVVAFICFIVVIFSIFTLYNVFNTNIISGLSIK